MNSRLEQHLVAGLRLEIRVSTAGVCGQSVVEWQIWSAAALGRVGREVRRGCEVRQVRVLGQ